MKDQEFQIFWKNELAANVKITDNRAYITRFTDDVVKTMFHTDECDAAWVGEILELRCFPRDRANADELLAAMGLSEYNPWEIVRKTHGLMYNDYTWLRWSGEDITYEDIKIRD